MVAEINLGRPGTHFIDEPVCSFCAKNKQYLILQPFEWWPITCTIDDFPETAFS